MYGGTMPGRSATDFSLVADAVLISTSMDPDGVGDACDVCADVSDPDQLDGDGDGDGDVCDICPTNANPDQLDGDEDGYGDACENCPQAYNPDQSDFDDDGVGDACDDADGDTVLDDVDNCRLAGNAGQEDTDGDGPGDACDNCPDVYNAGQEDGDGDGLGDACEDSDEDTVFDVADNCPAIANPLQENGDGDTHGDVCDNCPTVSNDSQTDTDVDGLGDACEALDPTFDGVIVGGGLAASGVGFAARQSTPVSTRDLVLTGVPAGAAVVSARIYWMTIGGPDDTLTINGTPVTGTLIATAPDTCWGRTAGNFAYRADVAAIVTGNGTYTIGGYPVDDGTTDSQGASILVVYDDPLDPRSNLIQIAEGAVGYVGGGSQAASTLSGFTIASGFDRARVLTVVGDGQIYEEQLYLGGLQVGGANPYGAADGTYWDTRWDDVSALVTAPQTSFETRIGSSADCLAWIINALVVEDVTGTATPPSL
jgi:hypothetical protein